MKLLHFLPFFIFAYLPAGTSTYVADAIQLPINFSIVREDSRLDLEIIKRYFPEDRISMLMVASGGCTAAQLFAQASLQELTLVDPNSAQLGLVKFKINLLTLPPKKRLEILGYLPMDPIERKNIMQGFMQALDIDQSLFGNLSNIAENGIDNGGRYEKVFEALRGALSPFQNEIADLFTLCNIQEQVNRIAPETPLGRALDNALDEIMSQENLVEIFGEKATANRVQDFSKHFAERIRWYLSRHTAVSSPWLAHMLLGHFYDESIMFPWLTVRCSQVSPKVNYRCGLMDSELSYCDQESYHVIHLSNILDWLSPLEAQKTLSLAHRALKPGGVIIIRQLNSNLDIPQLGKEFIWDINASEEFLHNDHSFFYRNFLVGFKQKESLAPQVKQLADTILNESPVISGSFFKDLGTMDKEVFKRIQSQFFFAVNYFSRPMAALIARLPQHKDRIDIIHNIVEEHGDFSIERYHANTFKQFLRSIDVSGESLDKLQVSSVVTMFNTTLMGAAYHEDPIIAISCLGIIEYAFADISALIGKQVVDRGWVKKEDLVHYNLHADIDKQHAEEFFKIVEPYMDSSEQRNKIMSGLRLGAYIFNRLYEDLYRDAALKEV